MDAMEAPEQRETVLRAVEPVIEKVVRPRPQQNAERNA
jgi:hypothetical protein